LKPSADPDLIVGFEDVVDHGMNVIDDKNLQSMTGKLSSMTSALMLMTFAMFSMTFAMASVTSAM
jgi:hypothetical protein